MYDAICLASGGLDSLVCLHLLRKQGINTLPLFVDYGQQNRDRELASLVANTKQFGFPTPEIIDVSGFGGKVRSGLTDASKKVYEDAFTPNRNLLFLLLASSIGHTRCISNLVLGLLSEKTAIFPDQTDIFLRTAELMLTQSLGTKINVFVPLRDFTKADVVELANEFNIKTYYSCHSGTAEPCGKCIACLEYN
jgi:7-cyano-7-deazaguanine synthase